MGGKSYTGHGDSGESGLGSGGRAKKSEPVFEAVGMLDELNSVIGLAVSSLAAMRNTGGMDRDSERLDEPLLIIQSDLLDAGSFLSGYRKADEAGPLFASKLKRLENWTDALDEKLPALDSFILPGGCPVAAHLHQARTVCRRAERRVVAIDSSSKAAILPYLNRLSSYFFARARYENQKAGVRETVWNGKEE